MRISLATVGRRSGASRTVELYAFPDGERFVVTGSRGGADADPSWVRNLRSNPMAVVRHGRTEQAVRAAEATGAERERLWRLVCSDFPTYATYQRRTGRQFPLFVLEPVGADPSTASPI